MKRLDFPNYFCDLPKDCDYDLMKKGLPFTCRKFAPIKNFTSLLSAIVILIAKERRTDYFQSTVNSVKP